MNTMPKENNKNLTPYWENEGWRNMETSLFEAYTALHPPEQISNLIFLSRFLSFLFKLLELQTTLKHWLTKTEEFYAYTLYLHGQFTPSPLLKLHTIVPLKPFPPSNSANN